MGFKPRRNFRKSHPVDEINEERFEYDLTPISCEEFHRQQAEYMDEYHGYDIGS